MNEKYVVKESFDEKEGVWNYEITMPEEDKAELDRILASYGLTFQDSLTAFFEWFIREPEKAIAWLQESMQSVS